MGHEWIIDVLKDLSSYARANGLPALAGKAEEALRVAEAEDSGCAGLCGGQAGRFQPGWQGALTPAASERVALGESLA